MGCLMTFSIGLMGAAIILFIQGNWKLGIIVLVFDVVISWIGGYIMMQQDKNR